MNPIEAIETSLVILLGLLATGLVLWTRRAVARAEREMYRKE